MNTNTLCLVTVTAFTTLSLACSQSPASPAAPTSRGSGSSDALPDNATLKVTAPVALQPINGVLVTDLDPDLVIGNSEGMFVSGLPVSYVFEVVNGAGQVVYTSAPVAGGPDGETRHEIQAQLQEDTEHTWRAWAQYQGRRGPNSAAGQFRTFEGGPGGESCAHAGTEIGIVACRKAQYGFIRHDQLNEFLRRVAYDLNRANMEHAPYGLLIKNVGANCHGYSCDIICSDRGTHRQWDVLIDENEAQIPVWNRVGEPTIRPCEPQ